MQSHSVLWFHYHKYTELYVLAVYSETISLVISV